MEPVVGVPLQWLESVGSVPTVVKIYSLSWFLTKPPRWNLFSCFLVLNNLRN